MILGFQKKFPWGELTNFDQKVLASFIHKGIAVLTQVQPKIHTLREDKKKRWGLGVKIHFTTGVRTKRMYIFKVDECTGTQEISIIPFGGTKIFVDKKQLSGGEICELAKNDGFDSLEDFWKWFNKPFKGRIIHWTEKRY